MPGYLYSVAAIVNAFFLVSEHAVEDQSDAEASH